MTLHEIRRVSAILQHMRDEMERVMGRLYLEALQEIRAMEHEKWRNDDLPKGENVPGVRHERMEANIRE